MKSLRPDTEDSPADPALQLADRWQRDFPLEPRPFARLADSSDLSEREVIDFLQDLRERSILGRVGAAVRPNTAGASTLAAMAVPSERLHEIAELVSLEPAVNHNYERDHEINLWFVVTAASRAEVRQTLDRIALNSGMHVFDLPLERAYHIDLGFRLSGSKVRSEAAHEHDSSFVIEDNDRYLLAVLETGLPLVPRPYLTLSKTLGWSEAQVISRLQTLVDAGVISRFGCILRHRPLGYTANAMVVWDVPDDEVDAVAEKLAIQDGVTLCYRRRRELPDWPYNLFAMFHGKKRHNVKILLAQANIAVGLAPYPSAILFSNRCFKQRSARFATLRRGAA